MRSTTGEPPAVADGRKFITDPPIRTVASAENEGLHLYSFSSPLEALHPKLLMASRRKSASGSSASIHVLHVELVDSHPSIWRELHVPSQYSLGQLHDILQDAFEWEDCHLHFFENRKRQCFGPPSEDELDQTFLDEDGYTIADLATRRGGVFSYIYDFGDDWVHRITVKAIQPPEPGRRYPACVAGARAGPPEDSGGIYGYQDKLDALRTPKHPDRENVLEWLGDSFDPDAFNLKAIDKAVRSSS